jgi:hypothetical protein
MDYAEFVAEITRQSSGLWHLKCHLDTRAADGGSLVNSRVLMDSPPLIDCEGKARTTALELARSFNFGINAIRWVVR